MKRKVTETNLVAFDEDKEDNHLKAQLKVKFDDMSEKIAEDFANHYKTDMESKIDEFAKEGTDEIFERVINK